MPLAMGMALAQAPAFEVASIRLALTPRPPAPGDGHFCPFPCFNTGRMKLDGVRVDIAFTALDELIRRAYRIRPDQLDGPDWMRDQHCDILANIPEAASAAKVPEMLQALLAERFKLAAHHETRQQPVYELRVNEGGPKLRDSAESAVSDDPAAQTLNSPQGPISREAA